MPFAGNIIPSNRISPVAAGILSLLPAPNQPSSFNNYFALQPEHQDTTALDVKIDHHFTGDDHLSGHFDFARPVTFVAPIFGAAGGFGDYEGSGVQNTYSGGVNYQRSFAPTLLAELRVSAFHYHNDVGIPGGSPDAFGSGLPGIFISGFSGPLAGFSTNVPWRRAEANIGVASTWTKLLGNHTLKWGADYRRVRDDLLQSQLSDPRGAFYFSTSQTSINSFQARTGPENAFASFLLDQPYFGARTYVTSFPALRANQLFAFAADKWQVSRRLTVDLGLRWEFYPPATPRFAGGFSNYNPSNNTLEIAGVGGVPMNLGLETHYHYFAPRVGAAYRLSNSTVFRAGFGISYTPFPDNTYAYNPPVKQTVQYTTGASGFFPAVTGNGGFLSMATGFSPATSTNPSPGTAYIVIPKNWQNPYVASWNVSVQRALPLHFTLDAAYVGNHGVHSVASYNLNVPTDPGAMGIGVNGRPLYRAFGRTADTFAYFNGYSSMYHALQVKIDRRFHNGLLITTAYTLAKGMGYQTDDDGGIWTYINPRRSYARNDFDRHQTFVQSYVYDLPFGFRVAGVFTLMTGLPMTFYADAGSLNTPGSPQTADQVAPVTKLYGIGTPWFTRLSFAQPTGVRFGTSGRNILSGPNFFNADASLFKTFNLTERAKLEIRGEAFNVTNTPQFSRPVTDLTNGAFGFVTGVDGSARVMQVGAKISF
jgi:outer membrane receptor protein involved in Fe transport